jgi:hypothetical protein
VIGPSIKRIGHFCVVAISVINSDHSITHDVIENSLCDDIRDAKRGHTRSRGSSQIVWGPVRIKREMIPYASGRLGNGSVPVYRVAFTIDGVWEPKVRSTRVVTQFVK